MMIAARWKLQSQRQVACTAMVLALLAIMSTPSLRAADRSKNVTFDDIKFDMKKGDKFKQSMLTSEIKKLNQEKIRIRGYILPASVFQQRGIKQFVLVRDNMECCFGPGAALYDCILVEMDSGRTASFTTRPVAVEGVFSVKEYRGFDGNLLAIYHLRGDSVK